MKTNPLARQKELRQAADSLANALLNMPDSKSCLALLDDLCTPAELEAIVDRWRVAMLLHDGLPYREIHDRTGVSVTTIGRVARFIGHGAGGYQQALAALPETIKQQESKP
jgi:TrpR-related protein YerC/YecD